MYAKCVSGEEMEKRRQRTAFQDWKHEQLRGRGAIVAGNAAACGRGDETCTIAMCGGAAGVREQAREKRFGNCRHPNPSHF